MDRDPKAAEELLPLVYEELRCLAAARMALQPPGQTLQATALVHEAWLKLAGNPHASWNDRQHFFRAAAEAMRQILIDRARPKQRLRRGANPVRVNLDTVDAAVEAEPEALLLVDEALQLLTSEHPGKPEYAWVKAGIINQPSVVNPTYENWIKDKVKWAVINVSESHEEG